MKIGDRVRVIDSNSTSLNEEGIILEIHDECAIIVQMPRTVLSFEDTDLEELEND